MAARTLHRLSARSVTTLKATGRHADGGGLYLSISKDGARRWVFLFRWRGSPREMGLGGARDVTLAKARELATAARAAVKDGRDPISERDKVKAVGVSFEDFAKEFIGIKKAGWKNAKHSSQWDNTLTRYVYPTIGKLAPADITTQHVTKILQPIWSKKTETASRVRGRLESILDAAKAKGLREGENPARWRGHLDQIFPKRSKVRKVKHHPALPFAELPAFIALLRKRNGEGALALRFLIHTAARTTEVIECKPEEFDLSVPAWSVPAERMKADRDHRVPLTDAAIQILEATGRLGTKRRVMFTGDEPGEPISNNTMLALLERMGFGHVTVHGFRSTFRDWASETTHFHGDVVEMALAHKIESDTEAAYRRGELFEKRKELMAAWSAYCESAAG